MQEQCGLQGTGDNGAPVHGPVEGVELACVEQCVKREREKAEDIKVGSVGGGPTPEQDIQPDTEVDERDTPHAVVEAGVGAVENHRDVNADASA